VNEKDITLLDELITECSAALKEEIKKNPKVGDLIKMMEFRMKLAPGDTGRKDLLTLLEKIRRENLPHDAAPTNKKVGRVPKEKTPENKRGK